MDSLYNDFLKEEFHSHIPPVKGLKAAIVEYDEGYLTLRMSRSNFDQYNSVEKKAVIAWANSVLESLSKHVPISLEVWK